MIYFGMRGMGL